MLIIDSILFFYLKTNLVLFSYIYILLFFTYSIGSIYRIKLFMRLYKIRNFSLIPLNWNCIFLRFIIVGSFISLLSIIYIIIKLYYIRVWKYKSVICIKKKMINSSKIKIKCKVYYRWKIIFTMLNYLKRIAEKKILNALNFCKKKNCLLKKSI